jgi:hypothetical protein
MRKLHGEHDNELSISFIQFNRMRTTLLYMYVCNQFQRFLSKIKKNAAKGKNVCLSREPDAYNDLNSIGKHTLA